MSGLVDASPPGASIVPYRNFTPPPETPDKLAVSVTPGSRDQYAIGSGEQIANMPFTSEDKAKLQNVPLEDARPSSKADVENPVQLLQQGGTAKPENGHAQALDYVTRTRQLEGSGKDPNSSAVGGFIDSTWLDTIHKIRPETLNMPPEQVLAMRYDQSPAGIALRDQATAQYASENSGVLQKAGLPVNPTNLRLAHFLGPGGAVQVLSVPPGTLMSEINPKAVAANPTLQGRTAGEVIQLANDQMNGNTAANMRRTALGPFNTGASAVLDRLMGDIDRQGKNYESAIAEGKDLRSVARAAMAKWELSSENPPKDMRENWNQWAGAAIGLAMLGGFFGKNHTAAINAAGEMLQAANQADVRAYDIAYKRWKDHNDNGLKLIELLHGEARDVINDAKNSYDMTVTKLATLGTMYQLQQHLDPTSVENIEKNLRISQLTTSIAEAQKKDADEQKIRAAKGEAIAAQEKQELDQHPEWKGVVPAWRHLEIINEAEKLGKGQLYKPGADETISVVGPDGKVVKEGGAYRLPDGSGYRWSGTNEPVDVPPGGKVNLLPKGSGRQAAQTVQAITGAASELTKDLQNAMKLPIASRMSVFMGVENQTPSTLTEALQHTLTRETVTEDDSIKMGIVFQGIQRELGILENQGRATGIVGLSDSNKMLMPQKGWSSSDVLLSYAQMRQIGEQDLEAYMKSPNTSDEQRNYMQELRNRLATAVPFTVQDVLGLDPTKKESVAEFADKVLGAKKGSELPPGIPTGSKKIGTYQGKDVYQAPDGSKWQP